MQARQHELNGPLRQIGLPALDESVAGIRRFLTTEEWIKEGGMRSFR